MFKPRVNRVLCYLADILTFFRILLAGVLVGFTICNASAKWVLIAFVVGELTDAFDGICARTFLYPDVGKKRWWREVAPQIDKVADISLFVALAPYLLIRVDMVFTISCLVVMIPTAIIVEIVKDWIEKNYGAKARTNAILIRRGLYVYLIALCFLKLVETATGIGLGRSIGLMAIAVVALVAVAKPDRASQEDTPIQRLKE